MGRCIVAGGKPDMVAPSTGILASDLVVGSVVKLMENGVATDYLVVNQGKPSGSSLYDDSCDGLWLLRKDIKENRQWHSSNVNNYENSDIHAWLNGDFFNLLGTKEQAIIKQVKIPYVNGTGGSPVASGMNGLFSKIFLLSGYEVGWTIYTNQGFSEDGACLSYFSGSVTTDNKRICYLDASPNRWWIRTPNAKYSHYVMDVTISGGYERGDAMDSRGIRPSLILPSNSLFDTNTLILKGVS